MGFPSILFYELNDDCKVVPCANLSQLKDFGAKHKHALLNKIGDIIISTVFLGMDHEIIGGKPQLFESAIIKKTKGKDNDIDIADRYSSFIEAFVGHQKLYFNLKQNKK